MTPSAIVIAMRRTWQLVPRPADVTPAQWASAYYASLGRCLTSHFIGAGINVAASADSTSVPNDVQATIVTPGELISAALPAFIDEAHRAIVATSRIGFGVARAYASVSQWCGREVRVFHTPSEAERWQAAAGVPALTALLPYGERRRTPDRRRAFTT